jgi:hypothetical protein
MRPAPIIWFERIVLLAYTLGLVNLLFYWREWTIQPRAHPLAAFCLGQIIYFGVYLLLIWLVARKGSAVARWMFAVLVTGAALLALFLGLPPPSSWPMLRTALALTQYMLALSSVVFLFGPDTRPWFAGREVPLDPEIFR